MNKKIVNNIIAIVAMIVLSIGIVVGIKFTNGDFEEKGKFESLDIATFTSENASLIEAKRMLDSNNETTGYEVTVSSVGFNAATPIVMKITFAVDKATVVNFEPVEHGETPGFGANMENEEFLAQFNQLAAPVYTADMEAKGTAFDQITGATLSSKAIASGINAACEFLSIVQ